MRAVIYCNEQNKEAARRAAIVELGVDEAKWIGAAELERVLSARETVLIMEHELVPDMKAFLKDGRLASIPMYVYLEGRLFDVHAASVLIDERARLIDSQEWNKAKAVNDVLCDMDFLLKNTANHSYPGFFQLESTDFCNSKCIMCEHYFTENAGACILSMEKLDHLKDAIQLSHVINLNGMGEPFISRNIKDQIDVYVGYGNRIVANTNMSYLDDALIERIGRDFDWLAISIDGATRETYESVRHGLSYDTLISNLYRLKEKTPDLLKIISMVIMRQNVCEMPELVELAHEVGAKQVVFLNLNPNIIIGNFHDVMSNYPKVVEYYSVKALEKGEALGIRVVVANAPNLNRNITFEEITEELQKMNSIPKWKTADEEKAMMETAQILNRYVETHSQLQDTTVPTKVTCSGICDWLLTNCYTDQHGNVSMCCRNFIYRAGTVEKEGEFIKVWNSPLMQKTRAIFYAGYLPESCLQCGMIEGGELKYLSVDVSPDFYEDSAVKKKQKRIYEEIFGERL